MKIIIPELSLVVLIGPSGCGKSRFARKHFKPTEVLSSDYCRGLVSDDENAQAATNDAFEVLHFIARKRLAAGKLTALRYPEKELVSVPALQTYCQPGRPFLADATRAPVLSAQQQQADLLDMEDVSAKRSLASREFALGIEALERFVRQEPLRRVHECVFGVLAPESERVDPRL